MTESSAMDLADLGEWLEALGLRPKEGASLCTDEAATRAWLKDGTTLCHLANKIRPGSIENVSY